MIPQDELEAGGPEQCELEAVLVCLILFAHRAHPDLPLVVAANRDEFYERATEPARFWPDAPAVLAGRDLEAGGTWLGVSRGGRFAAVTNVRRGGQRGRALRSRGELTRDFLLGRDSAADYARAVLRRGDDYNGFNLLLGDGQELAYCENLQGSTRVLPPGIYGLSNHLLDTPWPKVVSGKNRLTTLLDSWQDATQADSEELLALLTDKTLAEDEFLPDTGLDRTRERLLSPIFIEGDGYGTCCSTAVLLDRRGQIRFHERSFYQPPRPDARFQSSLE